MARTADKTDSYISIVLGLNGRVRPADLQSIPAESRCEALRTFAQTHGAEMELHLSGDELVAGPRPEPPVAAVPNGIAPVPAPAEWAAAPGELAAPALPADLTADGESAIDLLLGDYSGVPPVPAAPAADAAGMPADGWVALGTDSTSQLPAINPAEATALPAVALAGEPLSGSREAFVSASEAPPDTSRAWLLWWIPTLLLPLLGGAAAWFFLRRNRAFVARAMLTAGLVLGLLVSVAWLRYAEQIAAIADQRASDTVIVLPGK